VKVTIKDIEKFKQQALQWASGFDVCCCLDSNGYADKYSRFDLLIAAGHKTELQVISQDAFEKLSAFKNQHPGWLLGFLTYDLKNETEQLGSGNFDGLHFPRLHFFEPEHLLIVKGNQLEIQSTEAEIVLAAIEAQVIHEDHTAPSINLQSRFNRDEYIDTVNRIKEHIIRGDVYVTNFCQEFYADDAQIDPLAAFIKLNQISPNPFAAFYKQNNQYIICASPERFMAKRDKMLISQPIKGTAKIAGNPQDDALIMQQLQNSPKEQQENVMVVDLVRNDLTRSAKPGTVITEELFGIYSFRQVHQMISTVTCQIADNLGPIEAIRNTFPMGSMTGAPKVNSMRLMEHYERSKRGVYSGAVGYFSPDGDFDFNVVIRSMLYNADRQYLSFQVGSAITYNANAEAEYEECLLKASAIMDVLQPNRL